MNAPRSIDGVIRPSLPKKPVSPPVTPFAGPRQAVDIRPRPRTAPLRPGIPVVVTATRIPPMTQNTASPQEITPKKQRKWREYAQFAAIIVVAMLLGVLAQSLLFGQMVVAAYAVLAVLLRIRSSTTFGLAIISIVTVVLFFTIRGNGVLANNFAVYTFWLLVIGTLSLLLEVRTEQKAKNTTKNRV